MRAIVAGSGSIGRRHMRNLSLLGVRDIAAVDPDASRLTPMIEELGITPFTSLDQALAEFKADVLLVCTPPIVHVEQCLAGVRAGVHVFVEKPLSSSLDGLDDLVSEASSRNLHMQVGYNLRFHPGILIMREILQARELGKVLWGRVEVGQYLPDWRPWQDYRQSYTARNDLGGGIILDASHELDYITWLLGKPAQIQCMAGKVSDLEVDVEDCAMILMRLENGAQVDVHLDFVQRAPTRTCKIVCAEGTLECDLRADEVRVYRASTSEWEKRSYKLDGNDMYLAEVREFLHGAKSNPSVDSLKEGIEVMKMALEALRVSKASAPA